MRNANQEASLRHRPPCAAWQLQRLCDPWNPFTKRGCLAACGSTCLMFRSPLVCFSSHSMPPSAPDLMIYLLSTCIGTAARWKRSRCMVVSVHTFTTLIASDAGGMAALNNAHKGSNEARSAGACRRTCFVSTALYPKLQASAPRYGAAGGWRRCCTAAPEETSMPSSRKHASERQNRNSDEICSS